MKRHQRLVLVTGTASRLLKGDTLKYPDGQAVDSLLRRGWVITSVTACATEVEPCAYVLFEKKAPHE